REVTESRLPEVRERDTLRQRFAGGELGRRGRQDLTAVRDRCQPFRPVERGAPVLASSLVGLTRVHAHSNGTRPGTRPFPPCELPLAAQSGRDRVAAALEGGQDTTPGRPEDMAAVRLDGGTKNRVVHCEAGLRPLRGVLPGRRRRLEIREEERQPSGR